jgi:hypothetical protein
MRLWDGDIQDRPGGHRDCGEFCEGLLLQRQVEKREAAWFMRRREQENREIVPARYTPKSGARPASSHS